MLLEEWLKNDFSILRYKKHMKDWKNSTILFLYLMLQAIDFVELKVYLFMIVSFASFIDDMSPLFVLQKEIKYNHVSKIGVPRYLSI